MTTVDEQSSATQARGYSVWPAPAARSPWKLSWGSISAGNWISVPCPGWASSTEAVPELSWRLLETGILWMTSLPCARWPVQRRPQTSAAELMAAHQLVTARVTSPSVTCVPRRQWWTTAGTASGRCAGGRSSQILWTAEGWWRSTGECVPACRWSYWLNWSRMIASDTNCHCRLVDLVDGLW